MAKIKQTPVSVTVKLDFKNGMDTLSFQYPKSKISEPLENIVIGTDVDLFCFACAKGSPYISSPSRRVYSLASDEIFNKEKFEEYVNFTAPGSFFAVIVRAKRLHDVSLVEQSWHKIGINLNKLPKNFEGTFYLLSEDNYSPDKTFKMDLAAYSQQGSNIGESDIIFEHGSIPVGLSVERTFTEIGRSFNIKSASDAVPEQPKSPKVISFPNAIHDDILPIEKPGINVTCYNPLNGEIREPAKNFKTHESVEEVDALVEYLRNILPGDIVSLAVYDRGLKHVLNHGMCINVFIDLGSQVFESYSQKKLTLTEKASWVILSTAPGEQKSHLIQEKIDTNERNYDLDVQLPVTINLKVEPKESNYPEPVIQLHVNDKLCSVESSGLQLAAIEPKTGKILASQHFATNPALPESGLGLLDFLKQNTKDGILITMAGYTDMRLLAGSDEKTRNELRKAFHKMNCHIADSIICSPSPIKPKLGAYGFMHVIGENPHQAKEHYESESPLNLFYHTGPNQIKTESLGWKSNSDLGFAQLYINHQACLDKDKSQKRGLHVCTLDSEWSRVIEHRLFDTYQDINQVRQFIDYVNQLPTGTPVAFIAADECTHKLNNGGLREKVLGVFKRVGSIYADELLQTDSYRSAYSLISYVGVGKAIEEFVPKPANDRAKLSLTFLEPNAFKIAVKAIESKGLGIEIDGKVQHLLDISKKIEDVYPITIIATTFDPIYGTILEKREFHNQFEINKNFANWMQELPPSTPIALLATSSSAGAFKLFNLANTFELFGSNFSDLVNQRENTPFIYGMISWKGADKAIDDCVSLEGDLKCSAISKSGFLTSSFLSRNVTINENFYPDRDFKIRLWVEQTNASLTIDDSMYITWSSGAGLHLLDFDKRNGCFINAYSYDGQSKAETLVQALKNRIGSSNIHAVIINGSVSGLVNQEVCALLQEIGGYKLANAMSSNALTYKNYLFIGCPMSLGQDALELLSDKPIDTKYYLNPAHNSLAVSESYTDISVASGSNSVGAFVDISVNGSPVLFGGETYQGINAVYLDNHTGNPIEYRHFTLPREVSIISQALVDSNQQGFASIRLEGIELIPEDSRKKRGLHVVTLHQNSGEKLSYRRFDTHESYEETKKFINFLNNLPVFTHVAIAAADEFTNNLLNSSSSQKSYEALLGALYRLGINDKKWTDLCNEVNKFSKSDSRPYYRSPYALLSYIGATPGTANEQFSLNNKQISLSGLITETTTKDFHDYISQLPVGAKVVVAIKGKRFQEKPGDSYSLEHTLSLLGGKPNFKYGSYDKQSYALIGTRGTEPGSAPEIITLPSTTEAIVALKQRIVTLPHLKNAILNIQLNACYNADIIKNYSHILCNGRYTSLPGGQNPGFQAIIFDEHGIEQARLFLSENANTNKPEEFDKRMQALKQLFIECDPRCYISVIAQGKKDSRLFYELQTIFSGIVELGYPHKEEAFTLALIYRDNKVLTSSYEANQLEKSWSSRAFYTLPVASMALEDVNGITVHSGDWGFKDRILQEKVPCPISISGKIINSDDKKAIKKLNYREGLNLIFIKEDENQYRSHLTHWVCDSKEACLQAAKALDQLPETTFVIGTTLGSKIPELPMQLVEALAKAGSAQIRYLKPNQHWSFMGTKGMAPGSAPESIPCEGANSVTLQMPTELLEKYKVKEGNLGGLFLIPLVVFVVGALELAAIAAAAYLTYLAIDYLAPKIKDLFDKKTPPLPPKPEPIIPPLEPVMIGMCRGGTNPKDKTKMPCELTDIIGDLIQQFTNTSTFTGDDNPPDGPGEPTKLIPYNPDKPKPPKEGEDIIPPRKPPKIRIFKVRALFFNPNKGPLGYCYENDLNARFRLIERRINMYQHQQLSQSKLSGQEVHLLNYELVDITKDEIYKKYVDNYAQYVPKSADTKTEKQDKNKKMYELTQLLKLSLLNNIEKVKSPGKFLQTINPLVEESESADSVYFYISCHGVPGTGDYFLVPDVGTQLLSSYEFRQALKTEKKCNSTLAMDVCYAGKIAGYNPEKPPESPLSHYSMLLGAYDDTQKIKWEIKKTETEYYEIPTKNDYACNYAVNYFLNKATEEFIRKSVLVPQLSLLSEDKVFSNFCEALFEVKENSKMLKQLLELCPQLLIKPPQFKDFKIEDFFDWLYEPAFFCLFGKNFFIPEDFKLLETGLIQEEICEKTNFEYLLGFNFFYNNKNFGKPAAENYKDDLPYFDPN
ncbi:MAG: hypothetical protein K2X39_06940 [Silvanigrellaceae bacterium]|nr:hypothetical protein [Silvanigrellaceae bacterium]